LDLAGPAGYCQYYDATAGPVVGKVHIATSSAEAPGFHPVSVDNKLRGGQRPAGSYQVCLVDVYRDVAGQVVGCAAAPFANQMTVASGPADFRGSVDLYTGAYELQVYVGPIWGPGFGTAPATVDVP